MEQVKSSSSCTNPIVQIPSEHHSLSLTVSLPLVSTKKPCKLTPLEKKERDRLRMKEQSQRRRELIKNQYELAEQFQKETISSRAWYQQQRLDEVLGYRLMERDVVEPHRSHPAAAGYHFHDSVRKFTAKLSSPVFLSYSHALCPPTQAPRLLKLQGITEFSIEAEFLHPACHGYIMAKCDDCTSISPVFFFTSFNKISLDDDGVIDKSEYEDFNTLRATKFHQQDKERQDEASMAANKRVLNPLITNGINHEPGCPTCKETTISVGCPGCVSILRKTQHKFESTQRIKKIEDVHHEEKDKRARHKALQREVSVMPLQPQNGSSKNDFNLFSTIPFNCQATKTPSKNLIMLSIKSLPIGQLLSFRVNSKISVSCLYELYRAKSDTLNRSLHLLLPTTRGLFYLDERIAPATDTRNGVDNGNFLLEDFNLTPSNDSKGVDSSYMNSEYLLFAVTTLHSKSTPQLIFSYVQLNFIIKVPEYETGDPLVISTDGRDDSDLPQWTRIVFATCLLPKAVDLDPFQVQIRPFIRAMDLVTQRNGFVIAAEQREERERLLLLTHEEAKAVKLTLKKQQRNRQMLSVSKKNRRALEKVAKAPANHVMEESLSKL